MNNTDPDSLLRNIVKPRMAGDFLLSLLVHALLIGLTSFGLYSAWATWGVHAPNEIKRLEKAAAKEAAQAAAKEKAAAAAAAAATNEAPKEVAAPVKKVRAANKAPAAAEPKPPAEKADEPKTLPLDRQVEKRPATFTLDDVDL